MRGAGQLRHRASFARQTDVEDDYGGTKGDFVTFLTVWANVRETTGKERVDAGSVENNRTATIRVRKSSQTAQIVESDQVVTRGETWNIKGIANVGIRDDFLDILAETGGPQ